MVGVAAAVRRENGAIAEARVALTNMGPTPVRATAVEAGTCRRAGDTASERRRCAPPRQRATGDLAAPADVSALGASTGGRTAWPVRT